METEEGKSLKVTYHKLCLKVHPDQNSHPGATEVFKRLQDSYEKHLIGKPKGTPPLNVESTENKASKGQRPPKVVSVKTKKIRICTVTTLSAKDLGEI